MVRPSNIALYSNLLTFCIEALKQLLVIERTPEPQDLNLFNGLTVDEKREVEEFAQILKVFYLNSLTKQ